MTLAISVKPIGVDGESTERFVVAPVSAVHDGKTNRLLFTSAKELLRFLLQLQPTMQEAARWREELHIARAFLVMATERQWKTMHGGLPYDDEA